MTNLISADSPSTQHVLIVDGAVFGDVYGGSHRFSYDAANMLVRRGWVVTFLAPDVLGKGPAVEVFDSLRVIRYRYPRGKWSALLGNWALFFETVRVLRRLRWKLPAQVAWVHTSVAAAAFLFSAWGIPVLWTVHGPAVAEAAVRGGLGCPRRWAMRAIERLGARHAMILTFASEYMKTVCQREFGSRSFERKARVLPLGVHTIRISRDVPLGKRPPRNGGVRLISVRRLDPRMGLDSLIRAVQLLRTDGFDVTLDVVGEGPDRGRLMEIVRQSNLSDSVHMLGRLEDSDIIALYGGSHIAVLPSRDLEGFGLSMVEAMAAGLPVVVTPVGAMPTIIGQEFPELVARGINPHELAQAILRVMRLGENEYEDLCQRVQRFSRQFDWDLIIERYEQVLLELMNNYGPRRQFRINGGRDDRRTVAPNG